MSSDFFKMNMNYSVQPRVKDGGWYLKHSLVNELSQNYPPFQVYPTFDGMRSLLLIATLREFSL